MTNELLRNLRSAYISFDDKLINRLPDIYTSDIQFRDPFHAINGLDNLHVYFQGMLQNLNECRFEFHHAVETESEAVLFWTMHYSHKSIAGGRHLSLRGNSHLKFTDKVYYHCDYFDGGEMLYEHLPLVGNIVRYVKRRLAK